jgi:ribonuclease H / adenosylcobalamin/alpha-ribazole phosphatase
VSLAPPVAPVDARPHAAPSIANTVLLARHASTSWTGRRWCGRADPPLTAAGRREAGYLARDLVAELWEIEAPPGGSDRRPSAALLISPAQRVRQTAAPVEVGLGIDALIDPDLVEVDVGAAEGLEWAVLETRFPLVAAAIARGEQPDWPAGETGSEVWRRAARAVERILAATVDGPVVVVSHGAILYAIATVLVVDRGALNALGPAAYLRLDPFSASERRVGPADKER